MGVFSTKKKKKFYTAVQRMLDDDQIVLSGQSAITNWLLTPRKGSATSLNAKGLPDYMMEASMASLPSKFKRAYYYANKGHYAYGLPKAANISRDAIDIEDKIKTVLEAQVGTSVNLLYARLEEANYYHFMWQLLIEDYGYNPTTNELETLSVEKGFPCYLKTGGIEYCQATVDAVLDSTYFDQWGLSTESGMTDDREQDLDRVRIDYVLDTTISEDVARITYVYTEIIPDTTPPDAPLIASFDGTVVSGIAEKGSVVYAYDGTTLLKFINTEPDGSFELTLDTELLTELKLTAKDVAENESIATVVTAPYEQALTVTEGSEPTQTVFKREEQFDLDFSRYIDSAVPEVTEDTPDDASYVPDVTYLMACYTYQEGTTTEIKYITYIYGSDTIPEFEGLLESSSASGEFFPRMYARLNAFKLNELSKDDPRYKSSVQLGRRLAIDWSSWVDQVHDSIEDVGSVQQAFMTVCAPLNTDDPVITQYLFHYFLKLYTEQPDIPPGYTLPLTTPFGTKPGFSLNVADEVYEHIVSFDGLGYSIVDGNIGAMGTYTCTYVQAETEQQQVFVPNVGLIDKYRLNTVALPYHSIKFQISSTQYKEIRIFNASSRHNFNGEGTTVSGTDEGLVVPLDRSSLPILNTNEREILFTKCLYMFVNVFKVIKTKWYQRGVFKVVMTIAAIAIAVITVGTGAPISAYIMAAAVAIAVGIAVGIAINLLSKILVKLGVDAEIVTAISTVILVIAIFVGAHGVNLGNITPTALLQITNAGFQMAGRMTALAMQKLASEIDAFYSTMQNQQALLEEAQRLLDTGTLPISLDILLGDLRSRVMINLGESVDMFFTRTVGLGNLATIPSEMINSYTDIALTLPDAHTMLKRMERS